MVLSKPQRRDPVVCVSNLQQIDPMFFLRVIDPIGLVGHSALPANLESIETPKGFLFNVLLRDTSGFAGHLVGVTAVKQMGPALLSKLRLMDATGFAGQVAALFTVAVVDPIFFCNARVPLGLRGQVVGLLKL